jgi:hypothetical protein
VKLRVSATARNAGRPSKGSLINYEV